MSITSAEDNIIAQIKTVMGNKVRAVESLPGNWDDDTLKRLLRLLPGIFLVWGGGQVQERNAGVGGLVVGSWIVYVITGHASGEAARRRGDGQQAGAYELLQLLIPLLNGYTVPGEGTLSLQRVENLYSGSVDRQGVTVYACSFNMPQAWPTEVDMNLLTPFQTFDAQYDTPPLTTEAEHQKWLDGNYGTTKPDAHDTVAVPQ
ncbi:DUF1834 family protein [Polaromonas sp. JS666]|uniref:DUF1834 family protein n=1 Tax=Polaromonas sp. (strain JS666 / ATCC BAA-500) TaxID=296591 RepID=UPI0000464B5F|nr:DUF1834 family protein [Polaromonas sp. JS666]ABE45642.1 hypothetical protein Bpro_3743 [Polaromonas sp. JS666]